MRFTQIVVQALAAARYASAAAYGQVDSESLSAEFGKPTKNGNKEIFAAAPDVQLTVSYDAMSEACVLTFTSATVED